MYSHCFDGRVPSNAACADCYECCDCSSVGTNAQKRRVRASAVEDSWETGVMVEHHSTFWITERRVTHPTRLVLYFLCGADETYLVFRRVEATRGVWLEWSVMISFSARVICVYVVHAAPPRSSSSTNFCITVSFTNLSGDSGGGSSGCSAERFVW